MCGGGGGADRCVINDVSVDIAKRVHLIMGVMSLWT